MTDSPSGYVVKHYTGTECVEERFGPDEFRLAERTYGLLLAAFPDRVTDLLTEY